MKSKIKKISFWILLVCVLPALFIKTYFEVDNNNYETNFNNMNQRKELSRQVEKMNEHKTVLMDGYKIHYYVSGEENQETILFLHPAFSDHRAFEQQVAYFAKDYKVITMDLLGHGLSKANSSNDQIDVSAEHIKKILEAEHVSGINLVGVSVGSLIAQYYALKYPSSVSSLTALGGYDINKNNEEIEKAQAGSNFGLILRAIFSMKAFRKKVALMTCSSNEGQQAFYETTSHYERKSFRVMQGLRNIVKDREKVKPSFSNLILVGEYDIELAKQVSKEWHNNLENSEYSLITNAGHCANIDQPIFFNETVKEFIDSAGNNSMKR